ncbi:MAG: antibiotic biosynthesis monooxygenase [Oscillibacter sp.]
MLTWNVTYHCKPGQRQAFYEAVSRLDMRAHSKQEAGNVQYDYYFSAQDPDEVLLVESWTEPALQEAHCQTALFAQLQAAKSEFVETVHIDQFHF